MSLSTLSCIGREMRGREAGGGGETKNCFLLRRTNFIGGLVQHWVGCEGREVMILETCLCTRTVRLICGSPFSTRAVHFLVFLALLGAGLRIVCMIFCDQPHIHISYIWRSGMEHMYSSTILAPNPPVCLPACQSTCQSTYLPCLHLIR